MNNETMRPCLGLSVPLSPSIAICKIYPYSPPDTTWSYVTPPLYCSVSKSPSRLEKDSYNQPQLVAQLSDLLQALLRSHSESSAEPDALSLHLTYPRDGGRRRKFHAPRCNGYRVSTQAIDLGRRQLGYDCSFSSFLLRSRLPAYLDILYFTPLRSVFL